MEFLILFIPILILSLAFLFLYVKKYSIKYEILLICVLLPFFVTLTSIFIARFNSADDIEYLNYYLEKVRHTDKWDEYINRTCTEEVIVGHNSNGTPIYKTREYDCSYVEHHPERWIAYDNDNNDIYLTEEQFNKIVKKWGNKDFVFVDMHRDYYYHDGDAQDYYWDKNKNTIVTYTKKHSYENRVIHSQSQFKLREIDDNEAKFLGLYDYPSVKDGFQNPYVGYTKFITKKDVDNLRYINSIYGKQKQINNYVVIFKNSPISIAEDQRCYWQNGNKNEFITCVSVDSLTNELQWVYCFSWQDNAQMDINCRDFLSKDSVFNAERYCNWIENNINLWKRKEFADFKYIKIYLDSDTIIILSIISLIISIISAIFLINWHIKDNYNIYLHRNGLF